MHLESLLLHPRGHPPEHDNEPLIEPIYHGTKYSFNSYKELKKLFEEKRCGYLYSRVGNPNVRSLEYLLAELQGQQDAICVASGMAAISGVLLSLTKSGDDVLVFYETYKPSRIFVRQFLQRYQIKSHICSIRDHQAIEYILSTYKPKLVLFESPTNPMLFLADIPFIVNQCHRVGSLAILDNTFAGFHNHHNVDVDLYLHSLTKFAAGTGDATGGVVIGSQKIIERLRATFLDLGATLDPLAAARIQLGLQTYFLRYRKQCENAEKVADFLEAHPYVERVLYPGLSSHPQHHLARQQMNDFGTLVSFTLQGGEPALEKFCDALQFIKVTASLGSTKTILAPCTLFYATDLTEEEKKKAEIAAASLRLSVGIEAVDDILNDLNQALDQI